MYIIDMPDIPIKYWLFYATLWGNWEGKCQSKLFRELRLQVDQDDAFPHPANVTLSIFCRASAASKNPSIDIMIKVQIVIHNELLILFSVSKSAKLFRIQRRIVTWTTGRMYLQLKLKKRRQLILYFYLLK